MDDRNEKLNRNMNENTNQNADHNADYNIDHNTDHNADHKADFNPDHNAVYRITMERRDTMVLFDCRERETLLEAMIRQKIYVSAVCGGRGTCGKCRIQLLQGELAVTPSDRAMFSETELQEGYRLSCRAYPASDCMIRLLAGEENDFEAVSQFQTESVSGKDSGKECAIAIDIGTTTIAVSMVGLPEGNLIWTDTVVNRQRAYGADVITRIQASNHGKGDELKKSIQADLLNGIRAVIEKTGCTKEKLKKIIIAGNTTMGHLLLGYSCKTLGAYPFTPINIEETILPFKAVFETDEFPVPVVILPGISAFVGGDIVSGLFACHYEETDAPSLFLDLGTNGEMAVGNKNRILVGSVAAGPAFEGGNISCGVGSIAGAIQNVEIEKEELQYRTIGNKAPIGICGTGVVELLFELLKHGIIDETGLFREDYSEHGYKVADDGEGKAIIFTQKDIREFQLAKAAVRAGIEVLLLRYGINYEDIDTVFLAGGFGYRMNIRKAVDIGLLPKELSSKFKSIGNSSLGGAVRYPADPAASAKMQHIIAVSEEITMSNDGNFNDFFIRYLNL